VTLLFHHLLAIIMVYWLPVTMSRQELSLFEPWYEHATYSCNSLIFYQQHDIPAVNVTGGAIYGPAFTQQTAGPVFTFAAPQV